ncbi:MAG: aspartate carbamoyltransferase catalytic subunit [bacterium]|uniref:Aspartate carbamoyltransferase n=2 Tax=Bacteria candidate phyla TaxID=1783234 RepID=A0A101I4Q2_UNCT6|nr:MAG: Aspartate carbamoyltransferase [candidate division TA06 bacterium 32_111]KUK87885.1 MAG: Aspartate carbamoyltransferase [candidate division TA06 bacterium 34_109]MDI6700586.1 aspartate carbamoyltransferase catalytic subunit [bacterium]HAF08038.1 aspartate carbamoyltransferase [candidate division WOR-3 bacterium]HCP16261.1 aspartate carbamoyltransferase [candidate division WOR-3 bacterium]
MKWTKKHLLSIEELTREEIDFIIDNAFSFKDILLRPIKKVPALRGKTVVNLFFEPSTRTLISFSLAEKHLSADSVNVSTKTSSVMKGESLLDTAKNIESMKTDMVVIRHSSPGAAKFLSERINSNVVNAGDGTHEHPTQALLDFMTIKEIYKDLKNLKVLILGDILHSRVARSLIWGFLKYDTKVTLCAPPTLMPLYLNDFDVKIEYDIDKAIQDKDVVYILRMQLERQEKGLFPSLREYVKEFSMTYERYLRIKDKSIIMHPGPINRGVELDGNVADSEKSVILDQVTNGVAVRMAILYLLNGGKNE